MRKLPAAICLLALASSAGAETMRCGSKLVSVGDRSFEVLQKCGEPASRDLIGYTLGSYDQREFKIEEWVYGPRNGVFHILTFEGNRLTSIEFRRGR